MIKREIGENPEMTAAQMGNVLLYVMETGIISQKE